MNLTISNSASAQTMSSRELAQLADKRHDNVRRTMETLSDKGIITVTQTEEPQPGGGKPTTVYHVGKRDSFVVMAQLSPEFTARLVDRWQELEQQQQMPAIPQTYAEALQLAADQAKQLEEQAPKVEVYNRLAERTGDVNTTIVAKQLGTSARKLNQWMRDKGIKWQNADLPMAGYMDWFNVVALDVNGETRSQCLVTPKGQIEIAKRWESS